jgi:hypothetical protein
MQERYENALKEQKKLMERDKENAIQVEKD